MGAGAHEAVELHEHIEHAAHGHHHESGHGHGHRSSPGAGFNKRVALLISVLAALLAGAELGGKAAQNEYTATNIAASDAWNFYQAKYVRETMLRTSAEQMEALTAIPGLPPQAVEAMKKTVAGWRGNAERYQSEPGKGEGRKELMARAKALEVKRDHFLAAYHNFEYASAACQLAIVMASASVVTAIPAVAVVAGGLGVVGAAFAVIGWQFPELFHHAAHAPEGAAAHAPEGAAAH